MLNRLKEMLLRSQNTLAFTGAGVSTLSGIPDFRGKHGVYSKPWKGLPVEEILSLDCFMREPELFYQWAKQFVYCLEKYEPSVVHRVLSGLERKNRLSGLYTQNIDLLHTKAGNRKVFEIHGSPAQHHCLSCGKSYAYSEIVPTVFSDRVPHCSCGGLVKPDIVFYGEGLDDRLLTRGFTAMEQADLVLVLGSSLTVYPAASLPEAAADAGVPLVIVNASPTQLDRRAVLHYEDLDSVFSELEDWLEGVEAL